ncbi:MAG: CarD family transcriptional regulator [Gallicola sp.]|uniref:CarD family transcriptional regulator n=1 Tax=Gallicola sp. Sow4_E12 TaxID=3438785 RepID=UPI001852A01E|nr:CarD family transcriptional regulator [Gallicola sp.]
MFNIGDKIVYPMHGAGVIVEITQKEILGDISDYYILKMPMGQMKISVPVHKIKDLGIRNVMDKEKAEEVHRVLEKSVEEEDENWNQRYKDNLEKLRTGDIIEITEVYRSLYLLDSVKGLSMAEKKILNAAKKMLISELALVEDREAKEIELQITTLLDEELKIEEK